MTESGYLEYTVTDVITAVKTKKGDADNVTDATALLYVTRAMMYVYEGLDARLRPPQRHFWSFLQPEVQITLSASSTGTASGQGTYSATTELTTLTAASAAFDDSQVGFTLTFDTSGEGYTITKVNSTTECLLDGDASAETSGDTFSIDGVGYHDLPTGFRGWKEEPVFQWSASGNRYDLIKTSPVEIRKMWRDKQTSGYTEYYAIENTTFSTSATQGYRLMVAPVPQEEMVLSARVFLRIADPATAKYFPGGDIVSKAIYDAALAAVDAEDLDVEATWATKAQASLWAAIDADKVIGVSACRPEQMKTR